MTEAKQSIRKQFLEKRSKISDSASRSASLKAAKNFLKSIDIKNAKTISLYYPINSEISPLPIMDLLEGQNIQFCLPVVTGKNEPLKFRKWQQGENLVKSRVYSMLLEPEENAVELSPDIFIVPLVAFDEQLNRLGYGAGFYDLTLNPNLSSLKVGLAFEAQKYPHNLPTNKHDAVLDFIITEKSVY